MIPHPRLLNLKNTPSLAYAAVLMSLPLVSSLSTLIGNPKPIRALYAGHSDRSFEYRASLLHAFSLSKLNVILSDDVTTDQTLQDYIIYAPNGPIQDFRPFSNARAVLNLWAGVEGVATNPTLRPDIPLCRMVDPGLRDGMVEYVVGHTMRYHLGMDALWDNNRERVWGQSDSGESMNPLASERTVGILGLGELGGSCAEALMGLNFRVMGWSRREKFQTGVECHHGTEGLNEVLSQSDILILLLPNTPQTNNLINADSLKTCKRGVCIINAGRGDLIDEQALLESLEEDGNVSGATLDVFKVEPLPKDHRFWSHPQILVTPHIAAKTRAETAAVVIADNIRRAENGEPLMYVVDRDSGY